MQPTSPSKRYEIIDIIRGFALFGVLVANLLWTTQHFSLTHAQRNALPLAKLNHWIDWFNLTFIDFKFYTLFSFLFGLGFALQFMRAEQKGENLIPTYRRRLFTLLILGVLHALLLWFGDILHIYAILGFILILFRKTSDRILLRWIISIAVISFLSPFIQWLISQGSPSVPEGGDAEIRRLAWMTGHNWRDIIQMNWDFNYGDYSKLAIADDGIIQWYVQVFWKFLLGFYIGRKKWLQNAAQYLNYFKKIFPRALVIGLTGCLIWSSTLHLYQIWLPDSNSPLSILAFPLEFSVLAFSTAYLCGLVLLYHKAKWKKWVSLLAPLGRMALTNYLTQSAIYVILFYSVGFGLIGKVGSAVCFLIAIFIYILQIIFSKWWLSRYRFGPVEWLWRSVTYNHWQRMRLQSEVIRS